METKKREGWCVDPRRRERERMARIGGRDESLMRSRKPAGRPDTCRENASSLPFPMANG